jgi:hypothetical protein
LKWGGGKRRERLCIAFHVLLTSTIGMSRNAVKSLRRMNGIIFIGMPTNLGSNLSSLLALSHVVTSLNSISCDSDGEESSCLQNQNDDNQFQQNKTTI